MKQFVFLVTMLMQAAIGVSGQSTDEKAVRKALDEAAIAVKNQDVTGIDRIFTTDYTFITPFSGALMNKSERIAAMKSEKPREYFAYEDRKFRFYGNTAIITTTVKTKYAGQDSILLSKATIVMVKNNGRWQMAAGQATPIIAKQQDNN